MYISPYNPNYKIPDLSKFECMGCEKEFILSAKYNNEDARCPYCLCRVVNEVSKLEDPEILSELGCMAISIDEVKKVSGNSLRSIDESSEVNCEVMKEYYYKLGKEGRS